MRRRYLLSLQPTYMKTEMNIFIAFFKLYVRVFVNVIKYTAMNVHYI